MKSFSKDGKYLSLEELANYAVYQRKQCEKNNPKIDFGMKQMFGSIAEQTALYLLFTPFYISNADFSSYKNI